MADSSLPATQDARPQRAVVTDASPLFDTARFDHMARVAGMMARASLIPNHLRVRLHADTRQVLKPDDNESPWFLDEAGTAANCFLIVNQAQLLGGIDPFALAQVSYFVHGRLGYEGKLIQAVIERRVGAMRFEYFGNPGTPSFGIKVTGTVPGTSREETIQGTVAEWQTMKGSAVNRQWQGEAGQRRMLHYRGTREWGRLYAPGLTLGLLDDDDLDAIREEHRARNARPVEALSGSTSTTALAAMSQRRYNPMDDGEDDGAVEQAQGVAKAPEAPKVAPAPERPQAAAVEQPAASSVAAERGATPDQMEAAARVATPQPEPVAAPKRVPRGVPARVDRIILKMFESNGVEGIEAVWSELVPPLLEEMKDNPAFAPYEDKLREQRAVYISARGGDPKAPAGTATTPKPGDVKAAEPDAGDGFADLVQRFEEAADTCQSFDALDGLVEEMLGGIDLPKALDEEADSIIDKTRNRIAAAFKAEQDAATKDDFPGNDSITGDAREPGDEAGEGEDDPSDGVGQVHSPEPEPAPGLMSDDAIGEEVESWVTALRGCKTVAALSDFNAKTITPFMSGPNGHRAEKAHPELLDEARTTFSNRQRLLKRKESEQA